MSSLVCIDFETTYSAEYSLSKMTTEAYVRDPLFEVIGVGVQVDDGPAQWLEAHEFVTWAAGVDWSQVELLAHHAHFDALILSHHFGIRPAKLRCTLSMGRALHGTEVGGSLEKMARHYQTGEKGHEVVNAKGKHRSDFTLEEWLRYGEYCKNDVALTRGIFDRMLEAGFPAQELEVIDRTIRMFTEPVLELDEPLVEQFLVDEAKRKADFLARAGVDRAVLMSNDKFADLLRSLGVDELPQKVSAAKSKTAGREVLTYAFAKTDPGMQALLEHDDEKIRWVCEARLALKSTINETRAQRFLASSKRGPAMPVYLKYAGAHTFRWSGGDRMNFQNLRKGTKKNPEVGTLRKAVQAPAGHVLAPCDSSQIEARVLAWLSGHWELVRAFAEKRDVYSEFASVAYGRKVDRKANPDDYVPGQVGKICVLGLGFGLGWYKLASTFLQGVGGADPIRFTQRDADVMHVDVEEFLLDDSKLARVGEMPSRLDMKDRVVHCAVANALVNRYRAANAPIVEFWKTCETALKMIYAGREWAFGTDDVLRTNPRGILLPSGLTLQYHHLRRGKDGWTFKKGHMYTKTYGGSVTENVVQALARQIIAEQLLVVSARYKAATTTHDEIVPVAREEEGEEAVRFTLATMATSPVWGPGIPLAAEGKVHRSYGGKGKVYTS